MDVEDPFGEIEEVLAFRRGLAEESDRGCALWAAAYLDFSIEKLLEASFVADEPVVKRIFDYRDALGSFSAKINLAYAMGLIGDGARRELNQIRRIRNKFAHDASSLSFETSAIRDMCSNLRFHTHEYGEDSPRGKFVHCCLGVLGSIVAQRKITRNAELAKEPNIESLQQVFAPIYSELQERMKQLSLSQLQDGQVLSKLIKEIVMEKLMKNRSGEESSEETSSQELGED